MGKLTIGRALGVALLLLAVLVGPANAAVPADRYGFVHGCYSLQASNGQPIAPASGPFRMQATALGEYLLSGVHEDFLADPGSGTPTAQAAPSTAAEWAVIGNQNGGYTLKNKSTSNTIAFTPISASGWSSSTGSRAWSS